MGISTSQNLLLTGRKLSVMEASKIAKSSSNFPGLMTVFHYNSLLRKWYLSWLPCSCFYIYVSLPAYLPIARSDKDDDQMIRDKVFEGEADIKERKQPGGQKSIFYDLITGDDLPPEEKTLARLEAEAVTLVAAE